MPPVIVWAFGAIGAVLAGRWLVKEAKRINDELHPRDAAPPKAEREHMPKLEPDPDTGVYRPR